jgi:transglutaminase-like putative cysteine protease
MNHPAPPQFSTLTFSLRRASAALTSAPLWAALLLVFACSVAAAKPNLTVLPPPAWVQPVETPPSTTGARANGAESGLRYLLDDRQARVTDQGTQYYFHLVEQVASAAAVEQVAQLQLDFEPSYQSLVIHHINIIRAGQTINALHPAEIKIIQKEDELDERLFDGTFSAVVFLNDVRPGDVIDYAFSVNGDNPVLAGHYADNFTLARGDAVAYLHQRLLWPAARKLYVHARQTDAQPSVRQSGDETEYVWERRDVPAVYGEDSTPSWFNPVPLVQLSEFETWADVARWAAPLYEVKELSPALRAQVEEWQRLPNAEARLLAARRFVQDEVRYLGIELGPYSHTPTQPSTVFGRRFGDCKDKSLLLATILNALGIEAHPALVNTEARHTLDDWQPSPYAFDHVIVRASLEGKTYWIDPTISYQRGTLANIYAPTYERALVLRPDTEALTEIPLTPDDSPTTTVRDVYRIASFDAPVAFTVTTTFRGPDADAMRYHLADESRADLGKDYLNYYASQEPSIEAEGLPEVADDEQANVINVTERYTISRFWKDSAHEFFALRVGEELGKPDVSRRAMPLQVSYPKNVEQLIEIHLPHPQDVATGEETVEDDALLFNAKATRDDNVVRLRYTLRTKRDSVAAPDVERHLSALDRARDLTSYELRQGPPVVASSGFSGVLTAFLLLALGGCGLLLLYGWQKRRREAGRIATLAFQRSLPGARPETAIRLRDESEIKRYIGDVSCSMCGGRTYAEAARQGLTYDGQRLVVVQLECKRCRNSQHVYFAFAVSSAETV